jgi:penicillin amidase
MRSIRLLIIVIGFLNSIVLTAQDIREIGALIDSVEIITDHWGVPHIYAQNEHDLFFAQGYYAAKDRLFQFEIWRRQATGTVAEILGERELERDIGTRLFQFRGDLDQEMNHYHANGKGIIEAYVEGVNAYITYIKGNKEELPIEFRLLGIEPEFWTPAVVISRHQGLLGNIDAEIRALKAVALIGEEKVKDAGWFHPKEPNLTIDPSINTDLILAEDVIAPYHAFRRTIKFEPEDIIASQQNKNESYHDLASEDLRDHNEWLKDEMSDIGSNNWVIDGSRTESGYPIMANDPHRRQSTPSLRYMAHLVAPGWDVIGGGEPEIPGISIGHNQHGAWGLTVYRTDAEDLYVYELNPDNPHQYKYQGRWEDMRLISDTIYVKGYADPTIVNHAYTRHGPVTKIDEANNVGYAIRCGWLEVGGSPYLASLRMNQAKSWEEFKEACNYSNIPGENMVWMDKEGNIGWQAVGIAPIRNGWSGMIPVPGDGRYEWSGYIPIISKPSIYNPSDGIINTSNENVTPQDYKHWNVVSHQWSDPYRGDRVREVLANGQSHSLADMAALQTDYLSIPARQIVPLYKGLSSDDAMVTRAIEYLRSWDYNLEPNSIGAGIYNELERQLKINVVDLKVPKEAQPYISWQIKRVIEFLILPDGDFGVDPIDGRNEVLLSALKSATEILSKRVGPEMNEWQYGQEKYKHILLKHPLSNAVNPSLRSMLDVGPAPRGGNSYTVNSTGGLDNQPSGGSFRMIVDAVDWDHCLATNTPGQNGNPEHPHYRNLFDLWAKDAFFPLFYSRSKVMSVEDYRTFLFPVKE